MRSRKCELEVCVSSTIKHGDIKDLWAVSLNFWSMHLGLSAGV